MKKYNDGDDDGYYDGNKYINNSYNAATRSGSNGPICTMITTPQSRLSILEEDQKTMDTALQLRSTMYLRVVLYIYPINYVVKMCHKLLYEEIGVLDSCC